MTRSRTNWLVAVATALVGATAELNGVPASYNGLSMTPAMGWNNWATFECDVNDQLLLDHAQLLVDLGLRDVGYNYVVLDDCWSQGRGENGSLVADPIKFPNGMRAVADALHEKDLLFGMYSSAGKWTCAGYEGSLGHEVADANSMAAWAVDYFKYDNCFNEGEYGTPQLSFNRYKRMSDALVATGRPIVYSLCNWGEDSPWDWAPTISNSWRMAGDLYDAFSRPDQRCPCTGDEFICKLAGFFCSFLNVMNKAANMVSKARPGAFNDLDILEVGNGGSTDEEYKTHFAMWALLKSPLMMGNDLRTFTPQAYSIYTNPALLAVNQDPLASSVARRWRYYVDEVDEYGEGEIAMWSGRLYGGDEVVALVNAGNVSRSMTASLADIFVDSGTGGTAPQVQQAWDIYDLYGNRISESEAESIIAGKTSVKDAMSKGWLYNSTESSYAEGLARGDPVLLGKKIGQVEEGGSITAEVPRHGIAVYRLRPAAPGKKFVKQDL